MNLFPSKISRGSMLKKYLFLGAFERFEAVMERLGYENCCLISLSKAPRLYLLSRKLGFSYFQTTERMCCGIPLFGVADGDYLTKMPIHNYEYVGLSEVIRSAKCLVLDEDNTQPKRNVIDICHNYGVKSYVLQHGALGYKFGYVPLYADYFLAWGEPNKEKLIKWGMPEDRIIVTGNPRYEKYLAMGKLDAKEKVFKDLKLGGTAYRQFYIVAMFPLETEAIVKQHYEEVKQVLQGIFNEKPFSPEQMCIIKVHKGDLNPIYSNMKLINNYNWAGKVRVVRDYDPYLLARAAGMMMAFSTTYALDGVALEIPTVVNLPDTLGSSTDEFEPFKLFSTMDRRYYPTEIAPSVLAHCFKPNAVNNIVEVLRGQD